MTDLVGLAGDWTLWPVAAVRSAGMPIEWLGHFAGQPAWQAIAAVLREPLFMAALTWQSPAAVDGWAADWAAAASRGEPAPGRIDPGNARFIARYAQRYCAKNDSIGFFGPVGWARLAETGDTRVSGGGGLRWSGVFLERWAVETLARSWACEERVFPHLPVRFTATTWYDGHTIWRSLRPPLEPGSAAAAVLREVNGSRSVRDVATAAGDSGFDEILRLCEAGVLRIGFAVPAGERPERVLRSQVEAVADKAVRSELLGALDALDECMAAVAKAVTEPVPLGTALDRLNQTFTRITARDSRRLKSPQETGRTLVYPDCRSDVQAAVGGDLIGLLRKPLGLLLDSARWFTAQVAAEVNGALGEIYHSLNRRRSAVTLSDLHFAAADILTGAPGTPVHAVAADFRLRWQEILGERLNDSGELNIASADIAPLVAALFPASRPGWAAARNHSPDLMLARTGKGMRWVLGELHLAMNTLENRFFHTLADDRDELAGLTAQDMVNGRVVPCYPNGPLVDSRRYPPLAVHVPGTYLYWSYGDDLGAPGAAHSVPATALSVRADAGTLLAGPDGRSWELPVVEFFGEFLSALTVNQFRLRAPGTGGPRVLIDDLVVCRRSWSYGRDDLPDGVVTRQGYRPERLVGRWGDLGLPRYMFARGPGKPIFVDIQAPLMVSNLVRMWRGLGRDDRLQLEEMLPSPEELWLRDDCGRHYTSELRMIATDQRKMAALGIPALAGPSQVPGR